MKAIDYTKAITSGIIDFEQACALQGTTMTEAIREGIISFEEACELQGMGAHVAKETHKATAPKKTPKKAAKPKAEVPEPPKAEEGFKYTDGGCIIQYADKNTLKPNHLRRVNNAMQRLVKAGFCVSWKRIGGWLYIYHDKKADKKTSAQFKAALNLLPDGWKEIKGAIVDNTMLADYEDNFRPEA